MTRRRDILIGLCLAAQLGGLWASPALAQGLPIWAAAREPATRDEEQGRAPPLRGAPVPPPAAQAGPPALSMQAVLDIVRRRYPGTPVGGPTKDGPNYVVRWKTADGHVIDVVVDAVTGAIRN